MLIAALYTSNTGIQAASDFLDVVSNNVANATTTGFKLQLARLQDLSYTGFAATPPDPTGVRLGTGAVIDDTAGLFTQGTVTPTGAPLDLAVNGDGFFSVTLADGTTGYTRAGNFNLDASGQLVSSDGFRLSPAVTVPADTTATAFRADGAVLATTPAGEVVVGQVTLTRFVNPAGLLRVGDTTFTATDAAGTPIVSAPGVDGAGTLQTAALEGSNVQLSDELVNLIIAQRAFSANTQAVQVTSATLQATTDLIR